MTLNIPEHKNILLQMLKDIFSDTTISPFLGFKGGTAAYLFYDLDRFSVDLDFDLLDQAKEELVFSKISNIVKNYGEMRESRKKRFNLFWLISYAKKSQNLKVEVNRRSFGSRYDLKTYLGISMLVMKKEDMFAHKLVAMSERMGRTSRDIYDVHFFLKNNWPVNKKIVEDRSGMDFKELVKQCIVRLAKMEDRHVLGGIGELLDQKQKIWAKQNLLKDTIFLLKLKLDS